MNEKEEEEKKILDVSSFILSFVLVVSKYNYFQLIENNEKTSRPSFSISSTASIFHTSRIVCQFARSYLLFFLLFFFSLFNESLSMSEITSIDLQSYFSFSLPSFFPLYSAKINGY
jgi:hypothetical protein